MFMNRRVSRSVKNFFSFMCLQAFWLHSACAFAADTRPNIIFVLTDDLSQNLLPHMPNVVQMQKDGITLENYFVTDSLCCPSRSTIFTGKLPHNTGVRTNTPPDGGFDVYKQKGNDKETFAVAMKDAGYETAMMGKYMNLYKPAIHPPEPGWTHWAVAGSAYNHYNYVLNIDGVLRKHGSKPEDYITDVMSNDADAFIRRVAGKPFIIEIAPFSPHGPFVPAPRHKDWFADLVMPKEENFNVHPSDAPRWLARIPLQNEQGIKRIEQDFRNRVRSVQAIDEMIGRLKRTLVELGLDQNTYLMFSSDNGFHLGEHGLRSGKQTAFDHDIKVPLVVTGPGIPASSRTMEIAQNTDLCPTFAELAGTQCPKPDGVSLVSLLKTPESKIGRDMALIEHRNAGFNLNDPDRGQRGNPPSYKALRGKDFLYVSYVTGKREYYDLINDKWQLRNIYRSLPEDRKTQLEQKARAAASCVGAEECQHALSW